MRRNRVILTPIVLGAVMWHAGAASVASDPYPYPPAPFPGTHAQLDYYLPSGRLVIVSFVRGGIVHFDDYERKSRYHCLSSSEQQRLKTKLGALATLPERMLGRYRRSGKDLFFQLATRWRGDVHRIGRGKQGLRAKVRRVVRELVRLRERHYASSKRIPEEDAGDLCAES